MRLDTILRLGRVSNLPTVWTNALAGAVLAGGAPAAAILLAALALSAFYVGGMWLNDAFDAKIDARERPSRPIPSGSAGRRTVFATGFALLACGAALAFAISPTAGVAGLVLAGTVTLYDWAHKRTALAPLIMGATRFLAYALGALAAGGFTGPAGLGALGLFAYVAGLTYAAKQEAYDRVERAWPLGVLAVPAVLALARAWQAPAALPIALALVAVLAFALHRLFRRAKGDVPRAVVTMIAGIARYDATLIAATGAFGLRRALARCIPCRDQSSPQVLNGSVAQKDAPMNAPFRHPVADRWPALHPERLQLYSFPTPNGIKVSAMLEETGLPYEPHLVKLAGDTTTPEFLALNPNNKIPAIIDPDGPGGRPLALFESGAILIYLAEKTGVAMPVDPAARYETIQWVMFQMGGIGPMFGQLGFFHKFAGRDIPDERPRQRYVDEVKRLLNVLDQRLAGRDWIMGADYTIADIAAWPWIRALDFYEARELVEIDRFQNLQDWMARALARPASEAALNIPDRNG